LQRLKDNDESFDELWICTKDQVEDYRDYHPVTSTELAWLGYFLGCSSTVKDLYILSNTLFDDSGRDIFHRGLGNNKSIHHLIVERFDLLDGQMFRMLDQFMKNNSSLTEINVNSCQVGAEGIRQLSLAIGDCNQSLKHFSFRGNTIEDGQLVDFITALSIHPQLEELNLSENDGDGANLGRDECVQHYQLYYDVLLPSYKNSTSMRTISMM